MVVLTASHARRSRSHSKVIVLLVVYVKIESKRTFFFVEEISQRKKAKNLRRFWISIVVASLVKLSIARALLEAPIEFANPFEGT